MSEPDMITTSGREGLPIAERVVLLANDSLWLASCDPRTGGSRGSGAEIHDLICLRHAVDGLTVELAERQQWRYPGWLSRTECRFLAWRRGGHQEELRICRLQAERRGAP